MVELSCSSYSTLVHGCLHDCSRNSGNKMKKNNASFQMLNLFLWVSTANRNVISSCLHGIATQRQSLPAHKLRCFPWQPIQIFLVTFGFISTNHSPFSVPILHPPLPPIL